ncbi:UPF0179 family protein [Geoglobus sp.]
MSDEVSKIITLCGKDWAVTGLEFTFLGGKEECESCRLRKVCLKLRVGSKYKIVGLRNGETHPCPIHDEGVVAVEVVELPILLAVDARTAVEGAKITLNGRCSRVDCNFFNLCNPSQLMPSESVIIESVGESFECPNGRTMKIVEVRRAD